MLYVRCIKMPIIIFINKIRTPWSEPSKMTTATCYRFEHTHGTIGPTYRHWHQRFLSSFHICDLPKRFPLMWQISFLIIIGYTNNAHLDSLIFPTCYITYKTFCKRENYSICYPLNFPTPSWKIEKIYSILFSSSSVGSPQLAKHAFGLSRKSK